MTVSKTTQSCTVRERLKTYFLIAPPYPPPPHQYNPSKCLVEQTFRFFPQNFQICWACSFWYNVRNINVDIRSHNIHSYISQRARE